MQEITQTINEDTIDIFVPIAIKKRGGAAMLMMPKNVKPEDQKTYFDDKLIKTIGKAYKWKMEMEEGKFESLADIARKKLEVAGYYFK